MSDEEKYIINPITGDKILSTKFIVEDYYRKCDELQVLRKCSAETNELANEYKKKIDKAIEYINEYAWQEDIIGDMWTTTGEPVKDRYMRLEWDNCNELLEILKGEDKKILDEKFEKLEKNIGNYCGDYGTLESRLEETLWLILDILKDLRGSDKEC